MLARSLASVLVLVCFFVAPLAHAGEPDATWEPGFDDRTDDDAINTSVMFAVAVLDDQAISTARLPVAPEFVEPAPPAPPSTVAGPHALTRAPPSL